MYTLLKIIIILITAAGVVTAVFFFSSASDSGYTIWGSNEINFSTTGQAGDFIGGVVGTIFSLAGTLLIYLTFQAQTKQNLTNNFNSSFFELIRLHRENVSELSYSKFYKKDMSRSQNRKVFKVIFDEFRDCYNDIKLISNSLDPNYYYKKEYKEKIDNMIGKNHLRVSPIEMAIVDIAYSIVYYGIGNEGKEILEKSFIRKYNEEYIYTIINFFRLKPKLENDKLFDEWLTIKKYHTNKVLILFDTAYKSNKNIEYKDIDELSNKEIFRYNHEKYYGGHQHRLGHYFRHLFQSYKYINTASFLNKKEKYFYGKTLRAQLSTYEQALLFINSITSLGYKWELNPERKNQYFWETLFYGKRYMKIITDYNLIKNLPHNSLTSLECKNFYPNVIYESED